MTFQNILNFLLSPPGYVLIIFMFSVGARMFKSAQEQRAKKRMLQQRRDAERDSLRTGAKVPQSSLQSSQSSAQLPNQPSEQEQRRQRIEALRQQRIEQLNKIREQRQAGQAAQQAPQRAPQPSARPTPSPRPPVRPIAQQTARPTAQPIARAPIPQKQALTPIIAAAQQSAQRRRPTQKQAQTKPDTRPRQSRPRVAQDAIAISEQTPITRTSITKRTKRDAASVRMDLRKNIRNAMIYKEILAQPMGLRAPGSDPLSNG